MHWNPHHIVKTAQTSHAVKRSDEWMRRYVGRAPTTPITELSVTNIRLTALGRMINRYPRNWSKYDICLKCLIDRSTNDISNEVLSFIEKITKVVGSQYVHAFHSEYDGCFTILLRASSKFMINKASEDNLELLLDPDMAQMVASKGNSDFFLEPFTINHMSEISSISPFQYIYIPYKSDFSLKHLYACKLHSLTPFVKLVRTKILLNALMNLNSIGLGESKNRTDEKGVMLKELLYSGLIKDIYAIHDFEEISSLKSRIYSVCSLNQLPYDAIKEYFGESIAFDVAFFGRNLILHRLLLHLSFFRISSLFLFGSRLCRISFSDPEHILQ